MILPTGSALEIAEMCEASATYEGIERTTDASELGTDKHEYLREAVTTGDRKSALAKVPEHHRAGAARLDLDKLPAGQPGRWAAEVTFAMDVFTGRCRELGRNLMRRYLEAGLAPTEIAGTVDVLGLSEDREATVPVEYKTGWTRVARAAQNLQLGFAAVCSTEVYDRSSSNGAILYVREDDDPYFDVARFEAFDLAVMKERIITIGRRVLESRKAWLGHDVITGEVTGLERKKPRLHVGRWCKFCPVQMVCPAHGALARRFLADPKETLADLKQGLADNDKAALTFRRAIALKAVVDELIGILYARAKKAPIALGNGEVLGEVVGETETLNPDVVAAVVRELHGEEWVSKATSLDTSKAALTRMARAVKEKEGGTIKEVVERVLEEVSKRGGVIVKPSRTIKVHRAVASELPSGEKS